GAEGEQDAGDEVMDVAAADRDVAERSPTLADAIGREADQGEGAEEAGQQVEEDRLRAWRRGVAADRRLDRVDRRRLDRTDRADRSQFGLLVLAVPTGAAAQEAAELVDEDDAGAADRHRGEPDRRPLGAGPARTAPEGSDYFSSLMIVFTAAVAPSVSSI